MTAIDDIRRSIEGQLVQIEEERAALRAALAALGTSSSDAPRAAERRAAERRAAVSPATGDARSAEARSAEAQPEAAQASPHSAGPHPAAPDITPPRPEQPPEHPAGESGEPAVGGTRRPRSRRRGGTSGRRPQVVPAEKLLAMLGDGEHLTTAALAERSGGGHEQVLTLLRELEQAGQVRRSGERRSTRWRAVTDEDRIAQRVAELEARSAARAAAEAAEAAEAAHTEPAEAAHTEPAEAADTEPVQAAPDPESATPDAPSGDLATVDIAPVEPPQREPAEVA